jgi:hypothetical protein
MRRIHFAFCALALIGMAAPVSAQGPIRNWLRSRRPASEPQSVAPVSTVVAGTSTTSGTTGIIGGSAAGSSTTTSKYAPATAESTPAVGTVPLTGTMTNMPQYTSMRNGRVGLFGRRRNQEPVATVPMATTTTGPMAMPPPTSTNIPATSVPGTTSKPLPTTIDPNVKPSGATTPPMAMNTVPTTQPATTTPTRSRNRLFAGRFFGRGRMYD